MIETYTPLYRSPGLPAGAFRKVGVMHMHIDGAGYQDLVNSLVQELESTGARAKLTAVTQAVDGPQRAEEPDTYASHTPGSLDEEHLEYFSSSSLHNRADAVETLARIIPFLAGQEGVVIEVERVIGKVDETGYLSVPIRPGDVPITGPEVGFARRHTLPVEIHHAMDFVSGEDGARPPIGIRELLNDTTTLGLKVGGWFNFLKPGGQWSFRSNAFTAESNLQELVVGQYDLLGEYVATKGLQCRRWAIVEQVLGIWRSPFERV